MRRRLALTLTAALVAALAALTACTPPGSPPPALPAHVGFGLSAQPADVAAGGWMPASGVPWDYAYQYLAGDWPTWNEKAQFALFYAQSAKARGYIPVFPYYQLLQRSGPCATCGEAQRDLAHLNDATTMAGWFADFATLMKRLGPGTYDGVNGFGSTAVINVEPDLSGYANQAVLDNSRCFGFCTGTGNDPSKLRTAVASSGVADVAAYANTFAGFNKAIIHLRDKYAPNVLLGVHVSTWAPIQDIGSSTDPSLDAASLGRTAGAFAAASGNFDLVFNDVADRDAGLTGRWWDRDNRTFPNFTRWEQFVKAIATETGKRIVVW